MTSEASETTQHKTTKRGAAWLPFLHHRFDFSNLAERRPPLLRLWVLFCGVVFLDLVVRLGVLVVLAVMGFCGARSCRGRSRFLLRRVLRTLHSKCECRQPQQNHCSQSLFHLLSPGPKFPCSKKVTPIEGKVESGGNQVCYAEPV